MAPAPIIWTRSAGGAGAGEESAGDDVNPSKKIAQATASFRSEVLGFFNWFPPPEEFGLVLPTAKLAAFPFHSDRSVANGPFQIRGFMVEGSRELGMTNMLNVCYTIVRLSFE